MTIFIYPPGANVIISTTPNAPLDVQLSNGTTNYDTVEKAQLPSTLGAKTGALSLSVVPATDSDLASETTLSALNAKVTTVNTEAVVVSSSALPTGAASETTLSALNTKVTKCDTDNVIVTSNALPTGASTEATLSALNTKVIAVDTSAVFVSGSALPTGAAAEETLAALSAKLPVTLGQKAKSASLSVTLASDQDSGKTALAKATIDYAATSVTSAAYVELIASVGGTTISEIEIFDSSGEVLLLATGAATSEADKIYIVPGGNGRIPLSIAANTRVSVKALSTTASLGQLLVNFYG